MEEEPKRAFLAKNIKLNNSKSINEDYIFEVAQDLGLDIQKFKKDMESKKIKNIEAIKIDIEGYEDQALRDFISKSKEEELPKLIIIEHANSSKWEIDLFRLFQDRDYKILSKTRGNTIFKKKIKDYNEQLWRREWDSNPR